MTQISDRKAIEAALVEWWSNGLSAGGYDERMRGAIAAYNRELAAMNAAVGQLPDVERAVADERERARRIAKGFWLDYPFSNIADADDVCALCEGIADEIARGQAKSSRRDANDQNDHR